VEWVEAKRTLTRQRETLRAAAEAFRLQRLVVVFPSGRLARPSVTGLTERPWQTSAIHFAKKHNAPVIPMHIRGHNSWLFYLFWLLHEELRDITLFRELLNKKEAAYEVRIGEMFEPEGDVKTLTAGLRRFVTEQMPRGARTWRGLEQQSSASLSSG
jgi:putative hemolysin